MTTKDYIDTKRYWISPDRTNRRKTDDDGAENDRQEDGRLFGNGIETGLLGAVSASHSVRNSRVQCFRCK